MYQPWTGGNMDEGWTRWVLEQYEFNLTSIHNADIRAGKLRQKFDAIILADQNAARHRRRLRRAERSAPNIAAASARRASSNLKQFVAEGGTLVTMGNACDLAIEQLPIPVRNLKKGLTRDQHFAPGAILRLEVDTQHPLGYGVAPTPTASTSTARSSRSDEGFDVAADRASSRAIRTRTWSPRAG